MKKWSINVGKAILIWTVAFAVTYIIVMLLR